MIKKYFNYLIANQNMIIYLTYSNKSKINYFFIYKI